MIEVVGYVVLYGLGIIAVLVALGLMALGIGALWFMWNWSWRR
jgi:hypothetical protein